MHAHMHTHARTRAHTHIHARHRHRHRHTFELNLACFAKHVYQKNTGLHVKKRVAGEHNEYRVPPYLI